MTIEYEFYEDAAQPGLERLWVEATDWGKDTIEVLRPWFDAAPFGKPHIVTAANTESGEIIGQFRFMPSQVIVNGEQVRAVRPFGTIVTPAMREAVISSNPFDQPVVAMYSYARERLKAMEVQLIYMVPDPRWMRLFKMFSDWQSGSFPLWSLPVPLSEPINLCKGYVAAPLEVWDERIDRLWEKSSRLHGCTTARDRATLRWKLSNADYTMTAVEKDGELVGLVASRQKGDRQWLVCDMLCADAGDALRATLTAVANVAHEKSLTGAGQEAIHKVAVLTTPVIEPMVRDLGFVRDAYDFLIAVQVLDQNIAEKDVNPSRWYVSAND